jgi:hypothetical protein
MKPIHTMRRATLARALAAALVCAATPALATRTLPVTSCADDNSAGTLRDVLANQAQSGDTIDLSAVVGDASCGVVPRTAKITLGSDGELSTPLHDVTLRGIDGHPESVVISARSRSRVLHHTGGGTIHVESLTIADGTQGGADVTGGCIESDGSVALLESRVSNCLAKGTTRNRGAGVFAVGQLELTHSTVSDSHTIDGVQGLGGGIYAYAVLMTDSTISGNSATLGGGAYFNGYFKIERSTFTDDSATAAGAFVVGPNAPASSIVQSTFSGNKATYAAGIVVAGDAPTISNSTIAMNHSETDSDGSDAIASGIAVNSNATGGINLISTIIANNTATATDIPTDISIATGSNATLTGEHNLVMTVDEVPATIDSVITVTADPMLGPLQKNGGSTLTHVPAWNGAAIGVGSNPAMLTSDQRGQGFPRSTPAGKTDVGAVQNDTIFRDGVDPAV